MKGILDKVHEMKKEYIINEHEAQDIIWGINFVLLRKENLPRKVDFSTTKAEELRLTKIELAIQHRIDWEMKSEHDSNSEANQNSMAQNHQNAQEVYLWSYSQ